MHRIPNIIYEDDALFVFDKPPGLVINEAETQQQETLEKWLRDEKHSTITRSGIVHRLDKDTSGILLVAKTKDAMAVLQEQFADRQTQKEYIALVHNSVIESTGTITANLVRNPVNRHKFSTTIKQGRAAETSWRADMQYQMTSEIIDRMLPGLNKNQRRYYHQHAKSYTLLTLFPKTGRTHQIRVHMQALRYPLVSDTVYTGRKLLKLDKLWCARQFLHAAKLSFVHPTTGEMMTFNSSMPEDLISALAVLKEGS